MTNGTCQDKWLGPALLSIVGQIIQSKISLINERWIEGRVRKEIYKMARWVADWYLGSTKLRQVRLEPGAASIQTALLDKNLKDQILLSDILSTAFTNIQLVTGADKSIPHSEDKEDSGCQLVSPKKKEDTKPINYHHDTTSTIATLSSKFWALPMTKSDTTWIDTFCLFTYYMWMPRWSTKDS